MGLKDPKYNNQIKSFEKSQLISRIRNIFELSNHAQNKPYGRDRCKQATNASQKAKAIALYRLSKINIKFSCTDLHRIIFCYSLS
jgi:hypothetical protein